MRIRDWSSDVCSSHLLFAIVRLPPTLLSGALAWNAFSDHTRRAILTVRQFTVLAATYERRFFEDTRKRLQRLANDPALVSTDPSVCAAPLLPIGRAACRARGCQSV